MNYPSNIIDAFRDVGMQVGFEATFLPEPDGLLHRVKVQSDKPGQKSGWYVLYGDGIPAGIVGNWKTGESQTWCAKDRTQLTPMEARRNLERLKAARQSRDVAEMARHEAAAERAMVIWRNAQACAFHPYTAKKSVQVHGLRAAVWGQGFRNPATGEREHVHEMALLVPMHDSTDKLWSLAAIAEDGRKDFLAGGRKKGCYFFIGAPTDTVCVAEGYATAATIHESTGLAVAVAFDAGNLHSVALALRTKYSRIKIILCADDDRETLGNPGLTKATAAARAVGGYLAMPKFSRKEVAL